jgi:asparagine synthase (glutamine-hydrolysing)
MCGIVGYVAARAATRPEVSGLHDAVLALRHRGPSESGTHVSDRVLLGNTRLSIIDLAGGSQPMANEDGSVVVVYNGEIWNYKALRARLTQLGHRFATESDTEVLVHGYEEWGDSLPEHLNGMFAFGLWDASRERLLVARDRLGKKPLYYRRTAAGLAFGSDARSTYLVAGAKPEIAEQNVAEYVFQRYVVSPQTLFADVQRLPPAHAAVYEGDTLELRRYWELEANPDEEPLDPRELRELLRNAVRIRLMSDVPIGVLLSGGVDSTAILALACEQGADSLSSYTVGFADPVYDERERARAAAKRHGVEHHELLVGTDDFVSAWARLAWYRDEPIAESSEVPLLLLSEFAGRHVRVALSGDGGDEVFGGYPKYRADAILRAAGRLGALGLRGAVSLASLRRTHRQLGRAAASLAVREDVVRWVSWFRTLEETQLDGLLHPRLGQNSITDGLAARLQTMLEPYAGLDDGRRMLLGDLFTYLPDNMLLRSDKTLMGGSLEGRMPLLDVDVVKRVTAAPARSRSSLWQSKRILRAATRDLVPDDQRGPKRGFPVPIEDFLVSGGRALAERLLTSERCQDRGIFDPAGLRDAISGEGAGGLPPGALFALASFELWARANVDQVYLEPPSLEMLLEDVGDAPILAAASAGS